MMTRTKQAAGAVVAALNPQCRYARCLFLFGHMRGGTTALSNVLCGRPEVSGYGEAHIAYRDRAALGVLALNHWRRGSWRPRARYLYDKILHDRYDERPPAAFTEARALFIVRAPGPTIGSIRNLFDTIGSNEYRDDAAAADYYCARVARLRALWRAFPAERRLGLRSEQMFEEPDRVVAQVGAFIGFDPPLRNAYVSTAASRARGAGDPLQSGHHDRIAARVGRAEQPLLDLAPARLLEAEALYRAACADFEPPLPE